MKKIILFLALMFASGGTAGAAINLDYVNNGSSSSTFSHTCTGNNLLLLVGLRGDPTDTLTGITYNGVSMTIVNKKQNGDGYWVYLYYILSPATGTNNVVISGASSIVAYSISYTGVSQSGFPDASNTYALNATDPKTVSIMTVANNCWVAMIARSSSGETSMVSGTTKRGTLSNYNFMADSNGPLNSGSNHLGWNTGNQVNSSAVIVSFAPASTTAVNHGFTRFLN